MSDSLQPRTAACQAPLFSTISQSFLRLMSIELVILSNLCCLLLLPPVFPASGSFPVSWLFASGGQSTGASASATVLPINIQGWFPLGLTTLISLLSKGLSRVFSSTTVQDSRKLVCSHRHPCSGCLYATLCKPRSPAKDLPWFPPTKGQNGVMHGGTTYL